MNYDNCNALPLDLSVSYPKGSEQSALRAALDGRTGSALHAYVTRSASVASGPWEVRLYDRPVDWPGEPALDTLEVDPDAPETEGVWLAVDLAAPTGPAVAVAVHAATRRSWWGVATSVRCRLDGETWTVVALSSGQLIGAATTLGAGETVSAVSDPATLAALASELGVSL